MSDATITVTVSRKLNDDNYGHGEVFLAISGVTPDMTEEEIDALVERQTLVFGKLNAAMKGKVRSIIDPKAPEEKETDEVDRVPLADDAFGSSRKFPARLRDKRGLNGDGEPLPQYDRDGEPYDPANAGNRVTPKQPTNTKEKRTNG